MSNYGLENCYRCHADLGWDPQRTDKGPICGECLVMKADLVDYASEPALQDAKEWIAAMNDLKAKHRDELCKIRNRCDEHVKRFKKERGAALAEVKRLETLLSAEIGNVPGQISLQTRYEGLNAHCSGLETQLKAAAEQLNKSRAEVEQAKKANLQLLKNWRDEQDAASEALIEVEKLKAENRLIHEKRDELARQLSAAQTDSKAEAGGAPGDLEVISAISEVIRMVERVAKESPGTPDGDWCEMIAEMLRTHRCSPPSVTEEDLEELEVHAKYLEHNKLHGSAKQIRSLAARLAGKGEPDES